jgi:hypothetical protein
MLLAIRGKTADILRKTGRFFPDFAAGAVINSFYRIRISP